MPRLIRFALAVLLPGIPVVASDETKPDEAPVAVTIESTLGTASRQIRQFAFDGKAETYFASEQDAGSTDHFTLVFDRPVAVRSIQVVTGRPDGSDRLDAGALEVSPDGKAFCALATFADGVARGEPGGRQLQAVRVMLGKDLKHPLAIREFTIDAVPPVEVFRYPVEFVVDVSDAPELKEWAEGVARECVRAYPMINDALKSDGFEPPHLVRMSLRTSYRGVAAAGGGRITGSVAYYKAHPDDVGSMIHETVHIVQHYQGRNPSWLVEGVSDYIRFFKYEPGKLGPINPNRARYNGSYRTTAAFLAYLTDQYDAQIVRKLNALMREGRYKEEVFKDLTGKTVQELDEEWRATLRRPADPEKKDISAS